MKRYLTVLMAIVVLTSVLLVGCTQEAELGTRISNLETKLIAAESTIEALESRIEQLEERELTVEDIHRTLERDRLNVKIYSSAIRQTPFWAWIYIE